MKWSQFIFSFDSSTNKLLFNTRNNSTVLIPEDEYTYINNLIKTDSINSSVPSNIKSDIESLIDMNFILDNNFNEKDEFLNHIHNPNIQSKKLDLVILTTSSCNFKCSYCYENGISRKNSLCESDIFDILNLLEQYILKFKLETINLCLFGGEPTLNWEFSKKLLKNIHMLCLKNNILLKTEIISNGYLLNNDKIRFLEKYNFTNAQITLDGTKDIHDSRRMLLNGDGSFNKIIKNLHTLLKSNIETVTLRLNYDKNNVDNIENLLEFLRSEFCEYLDKINLSFGLIDSNEINESDNILNNNNEIYNSYLALFKKSLDLGFTVPPIFKLGSLCMSKRDNSIIISADKKLYKCLSFVGLESVSQGNLYSDVNSIKNYLNLDLYESCFEKKCEFIPICHQGCRFKSLINTGSPYNQICNYELLRNINKECLELSYNLK